MPESIEAVEARYNAALRKLAEQDGVTLERDKSKSPMSKSKKGCLCKIKGMKKQKTKAAKSDTDSSKEAKTSKSVHNGKTTDASCVCSKQENGIKKEELAKEEGSTQARSAEVADKDLQDKATTSKLKGAIKRKPKCCIKSSADSDCEKLIEQTPKEQNMESKEELLLKVPNGRCGCTTVSYKSTVTPDFSFPIPAPPDTRLIIQPNANGYTTYDFSLINGSFDTWLFITLIVLGVLAFAVLHYIIVNNL